MSSEHCALFGRSCALRVAQLWTVQPVEAATYQTAVLLAVLQMAMLVEPSAHPRASPVLAGVAPTPALRPEARPAEAPPRRILQQSTEIRQDALRSAALRWVAQRLAAQRLATRQCNLSQVAELLPFTQLGTGFPHPGPAPTVGSGAMRIDC